jgi:hypothetical protein
VDFKSPARFRKYKSVKSCDDTLSNDSTGRSTGSELDADLERVVDAWPTLPDALKAGILAMVVATACKG